jgi:hypothetical protein
MKTTKLILTGLAATAALLSNSLAQSTVAVTDPVGYVTSEIAATGAGHQTWVGPTLVNPSVQTAATTNNPAGTAAFTFASAPPSGIVADTYYVEISSGPAQGWWADVLSVTGNTVTTAINAPANAGATPTVIIRKHITLDDYLGATNPSGLVEIDDTVEVLDPITQATDTFVWVTTANGVPQNGWYNFVTNVLGGPVTTIFPGSSVRVTIKSARAANIKHVSIGHVKTTKTMIPIYTGDNWLSAMAPIGGTIDSMQLDSGVTSTGVVRENGTGNGDFLNVTALNQVTATNVALDPSIGGPGWFDFVTTSASGTTALVETSGFVVVRRSNQAAIWTAPAPTIQN